MIVDRSHLVNRFTGQRLVRGIRQTISLLSQQERHRAFLLLLSMNINAALNLIGLSSIVPFGHLLLAAEPLAGDGMMARGLRFVGFTSVDTALVVVGISIIALVLIKNTYTLFHTGWINQLGVDAERRMATELLGRVTSAPYDWLATQNGMVLREVALGRTSEWARSTVRMLLQLGSDVMFLLLTLALVIAVNPVSGVVVTAGVFLVSIILMTFSRHFITLHAENKRIHARLGLVSATEAILGGRDVRMSNAGEALVQSFSREQRRFGFADVRSRQWQIAPQLGLELTGVVAIVGIALASIWSGVSRTDTATLLAFYAVIAIRAIPVAGKVVSTISIIAGSLPGVAELYEFIKSVPQAGPTATDDRFRNWRRVILNNVSYTYPSASKKAIDSLDLTIERGMSLGIVGFSGAGKSTLIDVLVGLLQPTTGALEIDGEALNDLSNSAWRQRIGYVSQSPFMIDGTMAENITFGTPRKPDTEARCQTAAEAAGLDQFVKSLPNGLHTLLGDRGLKLSGGQSQRVAIARALYRDADLLVLDEATSALDSITEAEVVDAINSLKGQLTLVVVAHRLSTIVRCEQIALVENGSIIAQGPHSELVRTNAKYRGFVNAQSLATDEAADEPADDPERTPTRAG